MQRQLTYRHIKLVALFWILAVAPSAAQETVFNGLGSTIKRADKHFRNQSYSNALELYMEVEKRGKTGDQIYLKLARTSHELYRPDQVVMWYEKYLNANSTLKPEDAYIYAESLISEECYQKAIIWLKKYQNQSAYSKEIMEKIWRLQNIQHLYTDSAYYEVHPLSINTEAAEFSPAFDHERLIFVSNRKEQSGISKIDQVTGQSFQSLYVTDPEYDSTNGKYTFSKPRVILKEQNKGLHLGAVSVLGDTLIFTRSVVNRLSGKSILQLYWANRINNKWVGEEAFQYNSNNYSLSYPSLSQDGSTLYFVSDMPGGKGGNDIYKCSRTATGWSQPMNLGEGINTLGDETAPFIHVDNTLYFASNGHAGFGGLDLFRVSMDDKNHYEVNNMGYPVNTSNDDFALILNREGTQGFLASNRKSGGFDDDLYEVVVDLQKYPLIISGFIRYHDPDWEQSSKLEILPLAKLTLIDHRRNISVYETTTGLDGQFSLEIPYSSRYKIKVQHDKVGEPSASLEIPKNRKLYTDHEIVVVKEKFKDYLEQPEPEVLHSQPLTTGAKQKKR